MPSISCNDYFMARVPDFQALLTGYPVATMIQAAMALYWDRFQPTNPPMDEALLTERQKVLVALRAVLGAIPALTQYMSKPRLTDGKGGPAEAKFEELNKLLRVLLPQWQTELKNLEAFEGIFFDLLPNTPAFLMAVREHSCFNENMTYVPETGTWVPYLEV